MSTSTSNSGSATPTKGVKPDSSSTFETNTSQPSTEEAKAQESPNTQKQSPAQPDPLFTETRKPTSESINQSTPTSPTKSEGPSLGSPLSAPQPTTDFRKSIPLEQHPPKMSSGDISVTPSFLSLPPLGHREAPEKFKGQSYKVRYFVTHLLRLFTKYNVYDSEDRCQAVLSYSSRKVREFVEGCEAFRKHEWTALIKTLFEMYDATRKDRKYKLRHLRKFTDKAKHKKIKDISSFLKYTRGFVRIAGPVLDAKLMTEQQQSEYFFHGIHKSLRKKLNRRLREMDPKHDMAIPWDMKVVQETAVQYFKDLSNEFTKFLDNDDSDLDNSDADTDESDTDSEDSDSDSSDSELDSDSDDSDSDTDTKRSKKKKMKSKKKQSDKERERKKKRKHESKARKFDSQEKKKASTDDSDVEDLVKRLSAMDLDDPEYATTYYRAIKLDPEVKSIVAPPAFKSKPPPLPRNNFRNNQYVAPPNAMENTSGNETPHCFGCGSQDHILPKCPVLAQMHNEGRIKKDATGRYTFPNGASIRRQPNETILQAFERIMQPSPQASSNTKPQQPTATTSVPPASSNLIQAISAEEDRELYAHITSTRPSVLAAERDKINQGKNRANPYDTNDRTHGTRSKGSAPDIPPADQPVIPPQQKKPKAKSSEPKVTEIPPPPKPVEPQTQRYNSSSDDSIMEDTDESQPQAGSSSKGKAKQKEDQSQRPKKSFTRTRQSDLSISVDKQQVYERILDSKGFTLSLGELLGLAPDIAHMLGDSLKYKNQSTKSNGISDMLNLNAEVTDIEATSFLLDRHVLIRLKITVDGKPIEAIIDTGSMLNIVRYEVWRSQMNGQAMDITKSMGVFDANGGKGMLHGLVDSVPIDCGNNLKQKTLQQTFNKLKIKIPINHQQKQLLRQSIQAITSYQFNR
ncbi:hypothetical protein VNI00_018953 [Paramarasmius palmivorus]|uniref:CCHC-type domain-containing protein n=1 Tax=Paramarasmius palmivorus TaxID=297713 RepID=A0AAW0AT34_9AGAR